MNSEEPVIETTAPVMAQESRDVGNHERDESVGFQQVDPRIITVDRIVGFIWIGIGLVALLIGAIGSGFSFDFHYVWMAIIGAFFLALMILAWLSYIWPVWDYRRRSYRLSETGLEIHGGVLWRHRISIPVARVQHADVSQGPLQRKYGLGRLTINTAGTQNASVDLDGISHETAIELRDKIIQQRKAADVV